jgi:hypothetical protein
VAASLNPRFGKGRTEYLTSWVEFFQRVLEKRGVFGVLGLLSAKDHKAGRGKMG